jgi:2-polyprenyl-3-methyl-5-hydroxy-6-metoxy-1,4-benzoquinol methylase
VVGVDIVTEKIAELQSKGFNIVHYNDLGKLQQKFDVIVMGDVIEHVDNPVGFIADYSNFLNADGIMLITTPNAKRAFDFVNILISGKYWHNEEHTFWLCPKTMIEVTERAKMDITEFYWLAPYRFSEGKTSFKVRIVRFISNILMKMRKNFNENFLIILKKK